MLCFKELKVKTHVVFIAATLFSILMSIAGSIICKSAVMDTKSPFHVTSETDEFRFENEFGVTRCIKKGKEPYNKIINTYNIEAGNIENWKNGIYLNEYNIYSLSLTEVNGHIVNTEVNEEYMINTYSNNKKLKVLFHNTDSIREYALEANIEVAYTEKVNEYGEVEYIYENGYIEVAKKVEGVEDIVIAQGFDIKNFLACTLQIIIVINAAIFISALFTDMIIVHNFKFITDEILTDNEIKLVLNRTDKGNYMKDIVPAYYFDICNHNNDVLGQINLRVGHNSKLYYGGNIGYEIKEEFRGNHYAAKACKLIFELAQLHDLEYLYITCNPNNLASKKTCEYLGGELCKIAKIPRTHPMRKKGETEVIIYKFDIEKEIDLDYAHYKNSGEYTNNSNSINR